MVKCSLFASFSASCFKHGLPQKAFAGISACRQLWFEMKAGYLQMGKQAERSGP
jgi:hypothetical protein